MGKTGPLGMVEPFIALFKKIKNIFFTIHTKLAIKKLNSSNNYPNRHPDQSDSITN